MSKKENFRLDPEARKRINEEYFLPEGKRVKRVKAHARTTPPPAGRQQYSPPPTTRLYNSPPTQQLYEPPPRYDEYVPAYGGYIPPEQKPPRKKKHRLRKFVIVTIILCVIVLLINLALLTFRGNIWFNEPRKRDYPVRGAIITSDLGKVDWQLMSQQTISFVYIRATGGTAFVDEQFKTNRKSAQKTDLLCGYYHEFDFRTDGAKQAEHYVEQFGRFEDKLVPMVQVKRYGIYRFNMKEAGVVAQELQSFLDKVEELSGEKCIIMCDNACYNEYISGDFDDYALWTTSHFSEPDEEIKWDFWEFNPRVRSVGYEKKKKYYAITVYKKDGTLAEFKERFYMDYE